MSYFLQAVSPNGEFLHQPDEPTQLIERLPVTVSESKHCPKDAKKSILCVHRGKYEKMDALSSMVRHKGDIGSRTSDLLILESVKTAHFTPYADLVQSKTSFDIPIHISDDSTVVSSSEVTRPVRFRTKDGPKNISLSEKLVVPYASLSILSVPSLVSKRILFLFIP